MGMIHYIIPEIQKDKQRIQEIRRRREIEAERRAKETPDERKVREAIEASEKERLLREVEIAFAEFKLSD